MKTAIKEKLFFYSLQVPFIKNVACARKIQKQEPHVIIKVCKSESLL